MAERRKATDDEKVERTPVHIPELKDVRRLVSGNNHVLALTNAGAVYSWGSGHRSELGRRIARGREYDSLLPKLVALPRTRVNSVFAGGYHSFAIDAKGRVHAWGLNNFGQTGIPTDGESTNLEIPYPTVVESLAPYKIRQLACGLHHSLACTDDGTVLAWGRCDDSQMGVSLEGLSRENMLFDYRDRPRVLLVPTIVPGILVPRRPSYTLVLEHPS